MNFPISNFNDKKVTLEQELQEKTVAFRDLEEEEKKYLINSHKLIYKFQSNSAILIVLYVVFFFFIYYIVVNKELGQVSNTLYLITLLVLPILISIVIYRESETYHDINLPVIKTVGIARVKKHFFSSDKDYLRVNDFYLYRSSPQADMKYLLNILDQKVKPPVRIEYSPNTRTIWKIKMRNSTNNGWVEVFTKINYISLEHYKRTQQFTPTQPQ
jgi:hypothetical protein